MDDSEVTRSALSLACGYQPKPNYNTYLELSLPHIWSAMLHGQEWVSAARALFIG
jgi:hypothetical protein